MLKLGVENDIGLLNYLSSVSMAPVDKGIIPPFRTRGITCRRAALSGVVTGAYRTRLAYLHATRAR